MVLGDNGVRSVSIWSSSADVEYGSEWDLFGCSCNSGSALGGGRGDRYEFSGNNGLGAGAVEDGVDCGYHHVDSSLMEGFGYEVSYCGVGFS